MRARYLLEVVDERVVYHRAPERTDDGHGLRGKQVFAKRSSDLLRVSNRDGRVPLGIRVLWQERPALFSVISD